MWRWVVGVCLAGALWAGSVQGQVPGYMRNMFSTNLFPGIKFATNWSQFTNLCQTANAGDTIWLRSVEASRVIWVPTNSVGLLKHGVEIFIDNVDFRLGKSGDTAIFLNRRMFTEYDDNPATNYVWGRWTLSQSNQNGTVVHVRNAGSKLYFQCDGLFRYDTTVGGGECVRQQDNTTLVLEVNGNMENWGYDGIWIAGSGDGLRTDVTIRGRLMAADTAIEFSGAYEVGYPGVFRVGSIVRRNSNRTSAGLLAFGYNMLCYFGPVGGPGASGGTNWYIGHDGSAAGAPGLPTVVYCPSVENDGMDVDLPHMINALSPSKVKWYGTTFHSPTNRSSAFVGLYDSQMEFINCVFDVRNSSISNAMALFDVGTGTERLGLKGTLFTGAGAHVALSPFYYDYSKAPFVTNVNNTVSLKENVTEVFVNTFASAGTKSIILTNGDRYMRGDTIIVKDVASTASGSNIVLKAETGLIDNVAGATGKTINTDLGVIRARYDGTNWWTF